MTDSYLSEKQFAQEMGISPFTVRKSRVTGTLLGQPAPKYLKLGKAVRYTRQSVEDFKALFTEATNTAEANALKGGAK
jgi:hypothetical protein